MFPYIVFFVHRCYFPHLIAKRTVAQRSRVNCPGWHNEETGLEGQRGREGQKTQEFNFVLIIKKGGANGLKHGQGKVRLAF